MAGREKQRHVDLSDGIRLVLTDHGLDNGNRFTAEVSTSTRHPRLGISEAVLSSV